MQLDIDLLANILLQIVASICLLCFSETLIIKPPFSKSIKEFYCYLFYFSIFHLVLDIVGFYSERSSAIGERILMLVVIFVIYQLRFNKKVRQKRIAKGICGWCFKPIAPMMYDCPHCHQKYDLPSPSEAQK